MDQEYLTSPPHHHPVGILSPLKIPPNDTSDRLPTISAADALAKLKNSATRCISTGLRDLDAVLQNRTVESVTADEAFRGGISRGRVTEIYGPPGVGKTTLGYVDSFHRVADVMLIRLECS